MFSWDKSQGNIFKQYHFSAQVPDVLPAVVNESHLHKFVFKLSFFLVHCPPLLWALLNVLAWWRAGCVWAMLATLLGLQPAPRSSRELGLGCKVPVTQGKQGGTLEVLTRRGSVPAGRSRTTLFFMGLFGTRSWAQEIWSNLQPHYSTKCISWPGVEAVAQLQCKINLLLLWGENHTHTSWHLSILATLQDPTFQWQRKVSGINRVWMPTGPED